MKTANGREMELWEYCPSEFCKRAGYVPGSAMSKAIFSLSQENLLELASLCDPDEDYLIHLDDEGCSINHGNVGTLGVSYLFS